MGIQINGTNDNISASDGSLTIDGVNYSTLQVNGQNLPTAGSLSNRRININGAMTVAQRGTATALSSSSAPQAVDRMFCRISGAGAFTISQSTEAPAGFTNSLKWDCTTADASLAAGDFAYIAYRMEGQDVQHLQKGTANAVSLTASFWVRSNKTGDYPFRLFDVDNTRQIGATYTINSANTWELKQFTFDGDTTGTLDNDNNLSFQMLWWLASGTDRTSGSVPTAWEASVTADEAAGLNVNLADSTSNEWYITGVQLEVGTVATPFEHRSYGDELARCQRYCHKWTAGGDATNTYARFPMGIWGSSAQITVPFSHPVSMRTVTKTVTSNVSALNVYNNGLSFASGVTWSLNTDANTFDTTFVNASGMSGGTGNTLAAARFDNNSNAYILFTTEL